MSEAEVVDGVVVEEGEELPAIADVRPVEPLRSGTPPAVVQAVAVAAGSFVAGAATVALVRVAVKTVKAAPARRRRMPDVLETRSFLVDVHLLQRK